jgi:chromate transporter
MKYAGVKAFLGGVRPCVIGLILATAATMLMSHLGGFADLNALREVRLSAVDLRGIAIFCLLALTALAIRRLTKKPPSPILLIALSAVLGIILYAP